jgi:hypothetical protein
MYAAQVGRTILERYRKKESRPYMTAKEFFDEVFFPLFFDDERYLMVANNSKFDQAYKQKKKKPLTQEVRRVALEDTHIAISELEVHEGHLYLGGYTKNIEAPTSSQITNLAIPLDEELTYLSWFGTAAGVGVKGGYSLLFTDGTILDKIVEGWGWYRHYMEQTPNLKPHQIDTWNGQWLNLITRTVFKPLDPFLDIPSSFVSDNKQGGAQLETIPWSSLLFAVANLAKVGPNGLFVYVYSLGQTNTSIGFIPIHLQQVKRLYDVYKAVDKSTNRLNINRFRMLYETEFGFYTACKLGAIGLRSLEPKNVKQYISGKDGPPSIPKLRNDKDKLSFTFYKTWITAMLDNDTLVGKAKKLARSLYAIQPDDRGKKVIVTKRNKVLEANSQRQLVEAATSLLEDRNIVDQESFDVNSIREVVYEALALPVGRVPLFLSLVRFETALLNAEK